MRRLWRRWAAWAGGRVLPWVGVAGLALGLPLALYVGAYLLMLAPQTASIIWEGGYSRQTSRFHLPAYRWGGEAAERFFGPMNRLDRQLRPDFWDERVTVEPVPPENTADGEGLPFGTFGPFIEAR